jgi:hypothetical protein
MSIPNNTNILRITRVIAINESNYDYVQPLQIPSVGQSGKLAWYSTLDLLSSISIPTVSCSVLHILTTIQPGLSTLSTIFFSTATYAAVSTTAGLGTSGYVSCLSLVSTTLAITNSIVQASGVSFSQLISSITGLGSSGYVSSLNLVSSTQGLGNSGYVSSLSLASTVQGLGSSSYISSASLVSTIQGLGSSRYVSSASLASTTNGIMNLAIPSTVSGLASLGYVSSLDLVSTVEGLGSSLYVSTASLVSTTDGIMSVAFPSTVTGLGSSSYVSSASLVSTVRGLGSSTYVSSASLASTTNGIMNVAVPSTVTGLGSSGYVSSFSLVSTVEGLGSSLYVSTASLVSSTDGIMSVAFPSTVIGLGSSSYVSSASLVSTIQGLGSSTYVSSASLVSTLQGMGSSSYVSSLSLVSTVRGIGSSGYISSFLNIPNISTQRFVASSIGVNCNLPVYTLDVHGSINSADNIFINGVAVVTTNTANGVVLGSLISSIVGLGSTGYISSFINIPQMSIQTPTPYGGYLLDVNGPVQGAAYYSTLNIDITPRQSETPISLTPANFGVFYNLTTQTVYNITLSNSSAVNIGKYNVFRNNSPGIISMIVNFVTPATGGITSPVILNQYQSITLMVATATTYALF